MIKARYFGLDYYFTDTVTRDKGLAKAVNDTTGPESAKVRLTQHAWAVIDPEDGNVIKCRGSLDEILEYEGML